MPCLISVAVTLSSRVISQKARWNGLQDPCPGDSVKFTCALNNSLSSALRWTTDGISLYTFLIPGDIGSVQSGIPGVVGTLTNATFSTLLINLADSDIQNGTEVGCTDSGGSTSSQTIILKIIGIELLLYQNSYCTIVRWPRRTLPHSGRPRPAARHLGTLQHNIGNRVAVALFGQVSI